MPGPEEDEQDENDSKMRLLIELELLVSRCRDLLGNVTATGGKVLLTALLGLTGNCGSFLFFFYLLFY